MALIKWLAGLLLIVNLAVFLWPRAPQSHPAPPVNDINADDIRLLSEAEVKSEAAVAAAPPPPVVSECGRIGPWVERPQVEAAKQVLASLNVEHLESVEGQRSVTLYRLFVEATDSAGLKRLEDQLAEAGITEHFRLSGSIPPTLSLGLYSERPRADSVARDYRERGVEVGMREESSGLPDRFWLEVNFTGRAAGVKDSLADRSWGAPGVGLRRADCAKFE